MVMLRLRHNFLSNWVFQQLLVDSLYTDSAISSSEGGIYASSLEETDAGQAEVLFQGTGIRCPPAFLPHLTLASPLL